MEKLIQRLLNVNPGWDLWERLIGFVKSLNFEYVESEYLGKFFTSGTRLTFSDLDENFMWPGWLPPYVQSLYGMKAAYWEMSGGYADSFNNEPAQKGCLFSPAGNDEELGFPLINVPECVYPFQSNSSGATFFINTQLEVLYPNSDDECFEILDQLEEFTKKNIKQVLLGEDWFKAYKNLKGTLID